LPKPGLKAQVWHVSGSDKSVSEKWEDVKRLLQGEPHGPMFKAKKWSTVVSHFEGMVAAASKESNRAASQSGAGTEEEAGNTPEEKAMHDELVSGV